MIQDIVELIRLRSTVRSLRSGPMLPLYLLLGELRELQLGTILFTFWVSPFNSHLLVKCPLKAV